MPATLYATIGCRNLIHASSAYSEGRTWLTLLTRSGTQFSAELRTTQSENAYRIHWSSPVAHDQFAYTIPSPSASQARLACLDLAAGTNPHAARGPVVKEEDYFDANDHAYVQTPRDIGAKGGNVALLDGSAAWRDLRRMRLYRASRLWDADGAFGFW